MGVKMVHLVLEVPVVLLVNQVLQANKVQEVHKVQPAKTAKMVSPVHQVHLLLVKPQLAHQVNQVLPVQTAKTVNAVKSVSLVLMVHKVQPVSQVSPVHQVHLVKPVNAVQKDQKAQKASQVSLVPMVSTVPQVLQVNKLLHKPSALFARHSQTDSNPGCPAGTVSLWSGYSLLHTTGNNYHHAQDLGSAGSCAKKFNTMPTTFCGNDQICRHASRNDKSYWLTTSAAMPMMAIKTENVGQHISRCNVCEAPSSVLAVHSQTAQIPECPSGYKTMWMGYSFL